MKEKSQGRAWELTYLPTATGHLQTMRHPCGFWVMTDTLFELIIMCFSHKSLHLFYELHFYSVI